LFPNPFFSMLLSVHAFAKKRNSRFFSLPFGTIVFVISCRFDVAACGALFYPLDSPTSLPGLLWKNCVPAHPFPFFFFPLFPTALAAPPCALSGDQTLLAPHRAFHFSTFLVPPELPCTPSKRRSSRKTHASTVPSKPFQLPSPRPPATFNFQAIQFRKKGMDLEFFSKFDVFDGLTD